MSPVSECKSFSRIDPLIEVEFYDCRVCSHSPLVDVKLLPKMIVPVIYTPISSVPCFYFSTLDLCLAHVRYFCLLMSWCIIYVSNYVTFQPAVLFFKICYFREGERESTRAVGGAEGKREADSLPSVEPSLTTLKSLPEPKPEVGSSTDWATQGLLSSLDHLYSCVCSIGDFSILINIFYIFWSLMCIVLYTHCKDLLVYGLSYALSMVFFIVE